MTHALPRKLLILIHRVNGAVRDTFCME